jgi:hypothetical protein
MAGSRPLFCNSIDFCEWQVLASYAKEGLLIKNSFLRLFAK